MAGKEKKKQTNNKAIIVLRAIINYTALTINIAIVVCLLLSTAAPFISPIRWVVPSYFGLFFLPIWCLNFCFVIFWIWRKKWFFLISFFMGAISIQGFVNSFHLPFLYDKESIEVRDKRLSILSYNISLFGGEKEYKNITNYIFEQNSDIVCLQEFGFFKKNSRLSESKVLEYIGAKYPYRHVWYQTYKNNIVWGNATFSKYPIINKSAIHFNSKYNLSIYSDIVIDGDTIRLINNHLESNKITASDLNKYNNLPSNIDKQNIRSIFNIFSRKLSDSYPIRAQQAESVQRVIEDSPYKVIVAGDFNDVPQSYSYQTIRGKLRDVKQETNFGVNYTFLHTLVAVDIDHIFVDRSFTPFESRIDKVKYSDHYPVFSTIIINQ